jgi:serine/threonine protein kinase
VTEIEGVLRRLHAKKVIHRDLYLSSIMWKKEDDRSFSVKLVDFDAVHSLNEPPRKRSVEVVKRGTSQ